MEAFKALVASQTVREKHVEHKDKLLQTKLREKEVKEALKEQKQAKKQEKEEERLASAEANRFDRAFFHKDSKRYAKDEREKQKKEEHDKTGFMCEHGVWRCRICHPVAKHK